MKNVTPRASPVSSSRRALKERLRARSKGVSSIGRATQPSKFFTSRRGEAADWNHEVHCLRGVAVLLVVFHHFFPSLLTGGFVGVDVFFVISGYLITQWILRRSDHSRLWVAKQFFLNRAKRLLPALLVMLTGMYLVGFTTFLPDELRHTGKHAVAGLFAAANLSHWSEGGYFDLDAERKPLLHLWSLGIEEQFYFVWPILVLLWISFSEKYGRPVARTLFAPTLFLAAASLILGSSTYPVSPGSAFFIMPMRAWELLIGALGAMFFAGFPEQVSKLVGGRRWTRTVFTVAGYALILVSALFYEPSTPFPGYTALLPTVGALLVVVGSSASVDARPPSPKQRISLLAYFGTISYALYLWHWPVLTTGRFLMGGDIPFLVLVFLILLSIFIASLSTFFIEEPIQRGVVHLRRLTKWLAIWWTALLACGLMFYFSDGLPQRIGADTALQQSVLNENWIWITNEKCLESYDFPEAESLPWWFCWTEPGEDSPTMGLVGSSLLNQLTPGFVANHDLRGQSILSIGTCPVLWHESRDPSFDHPNPCALEYRAAQEEFLEKTFLERPLDILLVEGVLDNMSYEQTVARLHEIQPWAQDIVIVKYFRIPSFSPQDCLSRPIAIIVGPKDCSIPLDYWSEQERRWAEVEGALLAKFPDLNVFDPNTAYCDQTSCTFVSDEKPIMRDAIHLSTFGSDLVAAEFAEWAKSNLSKAVRPEG